MCCPNAGAPAGKWESLVGSWLYESDPTDTYRLVIGHVILAYLYGITIFRMERLHTQNKVAQFQRPIPPTFPSGKMTLFRPLVAVAARKLL
jgi:hypothetical protein